MHTNVNYDPALVGKLSNFLTKVEKRLNPKRSAGHTADALEVLLAEKLAERNSILLNQIIMENLITVQALAAQVRAMRNNQNKYFRIKKENKEERQAALRASKAIESSVDKMVSIVLDQNYDVNN